MAYSQACRGAIQGLQGRFQSTHSSRLGQCLWWTWVGVADWWYCRNRCRWLEEAHRLQRLYRTRWCYSMVLEVYSYLGQWEEIQIITIHYRYFSYSRQWLQGSPRQWWPKKIHYWKVWRSDTITKGSYMVSWIIWEIACKLTNMHTLASTVLICPLTNHTKLWLLNWQWPLKKRLVLAKSKLFKITTNQNRIYPLFHPLAFSFTFCSYSTTSIPLLFFFSPSLRIISLHLSDINNQFLKYKHNVKSIIIILVVLTSDRWLGLNVIFYFILNYMILSTLHYAWATWRTGGNGLSLLSTRNIFSCDK